MPVLALRLIQATTSSAIEAGYLPGSDVAAWLEEMARHPRARCFVVPSSIEEAEAGGLLVVPDSLNAPDFGPRVLPCVIEHGRVVVPNTSKLDPTLTAEEARRLLPYACYFFHPSLGLVAFEETDAINPESLIVPPLARDSTWHHALRGTKPPARLTHVTLVLPEDLNDLFGDASKDIGSLSPRELQKSAPHIERLRDWLVGGAAAAGMSLAAALGALAAFLRMGAAPAAPGRRGRRDPTNASRSKFIESIRQWTAEQYEKLQKKREREVDRLLKLLETDPEAGLRYALPLAQAGDAPRGQAPPGWRLGARTTRFGAEGGGGPADAWDLAPRTQWALQQKYRELANRELAAGHFDRAAYIFADLLGDWHAAAGALARGRRHQEAARVYLAKLNNKSLAAQCLEDGGLITEALVLHAELGRHEKCGDLLRRLGREAEAMAAYRESLKGDGNRVHDARLLFEKMRQPDLALRVLASGYPHSPEASECLERQFEYLARLHASDDAVALARSLGQPSHQLPDPARMIATLRSLYQTQSNAEVRHRVAIVATTLIGETLASLSASTKEGPFLAALPHFASSDLLLKRDAHRFTDIRERARRLRRAASPRVPPTDRQGSALAHRGTLRLPQHGTVWRHLISEGSRWMAIGRGDSPNQDIWVFGESERIIGRLASPSSWPNDLGPWPSLLPGSNLAWLPFSNYGPHARYGQAGKADFATRPNTFDMLVDRLHWMPPGLLAVLPREDGVWIAHHNLTETLDLSFFSYQGSLIRTHALGCPPPETTYPLKIAAHGERLVLGIGTHLLLIRNGTVRYEATLSSPILQLAATLPVHPQAFLAITHTSVIIVTAGSQDTFTMEEVFTSSNADEPPKGCILSDGRIAVADASSGLLFSAHPELKPIGTFPSTHQDQNHPSPTVACAAWGQRELAVLRASGQLDWYA